MDSVTSFHSFVELRHCLFAAMSHHLARLYQQGDQGQEHADEGCVLEQHLFESVRLHVCCSHDGQGKQADCSRPAELAIEEVDHSFLEGFLVYLLLISRVFFNIVPFPISSPVLLRH